MTTYALTIHQPWASLIVQGWKTVENRTWATAYRGRLWVHAGRKVDEDCLAFQSKILECGPLVRGAIIGHAELVSITGRPGDYRWHLRNPVELTEPIICRGWPGLWRWPR